MDRAEEQPPEETEPEAVAAPSGLRGWAAVAQERSRLLAERAQEERSRHDSVDAVFEMADRDSELGGGIIAGAIAYRLFIWLLPLALVVVAGLGFASDAADESPTEAADKLGLAGLVSSSVANAAQGSNRWYALLVGLPILVYVTRSVLRVLISSHRLLWEDARAQAPRPTLLATLQLLGLLLGFGIVSTLASAARASSEVSGVLVTVLAVIPYAALWLAVSLRLPHRGADWRTLAPGALLVGAGVEALHLLTAYVLVPYALAKQGTYGALGTAAALLFGLFLVSRLVVAAAVLNATLWERRRRRAAA